MSNTTTQNDMAKNWEEDHKATIKLIRNVWIDKQVEVIDGRHPHFGKTGTIISFDYISTLHRPALKVKSADSEFYVFEPKFLRII